MGEGSRVLKKMPSSFWERFKQKLDARGMLRGSLQRPEGLQRLLVMLEPFEEILTQPSLGPGQPAAVSQVVAHLFDEFHLFIQEVVLQEVTEMRVCVGRTQGMQIPKGLVQVLLQDHGGFHDVLSLTPLTLGRLPHILEENEALVLVLHL
ncbi:hypothetical protein HJG60_011855 [Phyllostomus discolor]|uniref:Uncharacterized protein n=1 Tax=Phyllostomus discolor TaxID=89673 RepID=A0A833ZLN4_9CHIR|nr:hypothetical protein HJG60_011855 [Phyllostomus discolor]